MGYYVNKYRTSIKTGKALWRLIYQWWEDGQRKQRQVGEEEYARLGFSPEMSLEEAKARAKELELEDKRVNTEKRRNKILAAVKLEDQIKSDFLPAPIVKAFEVEIIGKRLMKDEGVEDPKTASHWRAVKRMIRTVKLPVKDYADKPELFYSYMETHAFSPSYVKKMVRILNLWGHFFARTTSSAFLPCPTPIGRNMQRIADKYTQRAGTGKVSEPITPEDISQLEGKLKPELLNWLKLSVWFGLKPDEVDQLKDSSFYKISKTTSGMPVLEIQHTESQWRSIPCLLPEQEKALEIVQSQNFKRPLPKTLKAYLNKSVNTYGGRKGFPRLMAAKGFGIEKISAWMGNATLDRAWQEYSGKQKAAL